MSLIDSYRLGVLNLYAPPLSAMVLGMQHRHLDHNEYTAAAIDNIIARGGRSDWVELRDATADPVVVEKILRVCRAHTDAPYAQRYHLWRYYVSRPAA
jgi:hypothetical protein